MVWSGLVQSNILPNLKLDRQSDSANLLNLRPDLPEPIEHV
jgi:hypothetical protein